MTGKNKNGIFLMGQRGGKDPNAKQSLSINSCFVILRSERLLAEIRIGLDRGIQNLLKTLDSRFHGNDALELKVAFIDRN